MTVLFLTTSLGMTLPLFSLLTARGPIHLLLCFLAGKALVAVVFGTWLILETRATEYGKVAVFHSSVNDAVLIGLGTGIIWLQTRLRAMYHPQMTSALIFVLCLAWHVRLLIIHHAMTRTGPLEITALQINIYEVAGLCLTASGLGLTCLMIYSALRRILARPCPIPGPPTTNPKQP